MSVLNILYYPSNDRVVKIDSVSVTVEEWIISVHFRTVFLYLKIIDLIHYRRILLKSTGITIRGVRGIKKHEGEEWPALISVIQNFPETSCLVFFSLISSLARELIFNRPFRHVYKRRTTHLRISQ